MNDATPTILQVLASGMTHDEILADYPDLEAEDILAVLEYADGQESGTDPQTGDPDSSDLRVDRTALTVVPPFDDSDERAYWHSRTPAERLRHVEILRRINYGSRATERLQRVLEFAPVPWR